MSIVLVLLMVTALVVAATFALFRSGLRSGDRPGDSRVTVRLGTHPQADTAGHYAEVRVDNFGTVAVVASAAVTSIPAWTLPLRAPMSVRVPRPSRGVAAPAPGVNQTRQVVVVDGGGVAGIFEVALLADSGNGGSVDAGSVNAGSVDGCRRAVRIDVTVHQAGNRTRVLRFARAVPPAPPAPRDQGMVDNQPIGSPSH